MQSFVSQKEIKKKTLKKMEGAKNMESSQKSAKFKPNLNPTRS